MKKYISIASLLVLILATSCTANNQNMKQAVPDQVRINKSAGPNQNKSVAPNTQAPIVTMSSSIATPGARSISAKQLTIPFPDWFNIGQPPFQFPDNPFLTTPPAPNRPPTTTPAPAPAPAPKPGPSAPADQNRSSTAFEQQVLDLVNNARSKAGLGSLSKDDSLANVAMVKAKDMYDNNYFDHNSPTYGSPFDMMRQFQISYNSAGENIARGQSSPNQVMNDWMNSEGHRANILNNSFKKIGIAYYNGVWVQEFIG